MTVNMLSLIGKTIKWERKLEREVVLVLVENKTSNCCSRCLRTLKKLYVTRKVETAPQGQVLLYCYGIHLHVTHFVHYQRSKPLHIFAHVFNFLKVQHIAQTYDNNWHLCFFNWRSISTNNRIMECCNTDTVYKI